MYNEDDDYYDGPTDEMWQMPEEPLEDQYGMDWESINKAMPENQWALASLLDAAIKHIDDAINDDEKRLPTGLMNSLLSQSAVTLRQRGKGEILLQDLTDEVEVMIRNRRREHALSLGTLDLSWDDHGNGFFTLKDKPYCGLWKYKNGYTSK